MNTPDTERTYTVELTANQVFGFSDLVRRLVRADGPDMAQPLRSDLAEALAAFAALLPEPSEADGKTYCDALDQGQLPRWGMDPLPLTRPAVRF